MAGRQVTERPCLYGVDTMLFVYYFENNREFGSLAATVFQRAETGHHRLVSSVLSLLEVLVVPKRHGLQELVEQYREIFESFPNLVIQSIDNTVVEIASDLRAKHNLRTPDSIHVATAIHGNARAFVSQDAELKRKVTEIPVLTLEEIAEQAPE